MHFGLGLYGCDHADRHWAPIEEARDVRTRLRTLLGSALATPAAATYARIVVSLHSGAWDVLATKECANISSALLHSPNTWLAAAETHLLSAAMDVVAQSPAARRVQLPMLWRTVPLICRSFAGGEDASELFTAVSALGARLACRAGLSLVDWRTLSCNRFNQSLLLSDGTHYEDAAYGAMAHELERRADGARRGGRALGAAADTDPCRVDQPRCECRLCHTYEAFTWKLGRRSTPCSKAEPAVLLPPAAREPTQAARPRAEQPPSCRRGSLPASAAPVALFSLAAYANLTTSAWHAATVRGWHANAALLHVYVVASSPVPPSWAPAGSNVVPLFVDRLFDALLAFAGIETPLARLERPPRAASFAPLLANFAEETCGLKLGAYSHFGTVELDVILGDLRPFIGPYLLPGAGYDAVALRWAPPSPSRAALWRSNADAAFFNTLADAMPGAVPLSTPLLLVRNNATTRRWWFAAEQWLRAREQPGYYSLRRAVTCKTCTGPNYWFDEHNFGNYWRSQLPSATTAYACCAFDDHHAAHNDGCTVDWSPSSGVITRTCQSLANFSWDGWGGLGCERQRDTASRDGCAKLRRHGAPVACTSPMRSFAYDVAWQPSRSSSAAVIGGGDAADALLAAAGGACRGVPVSRTVAAFHAARSKQHAVAEAPLAAENIELHPRFLATSRAPPASGHRRPATRLCDEPLCR